MRLWKTASLVLLALVIATGYGIALVRRGFSTRASVRRASSIVLHQSLLNSGGRTGVPQFLYPHYPATEGFAGMSIVTNKSDDPVDPFRRARHT